MRIFTAALHCLSLVGLLVISSTSLAQSSPSSSSSDAQAIALAGRAITALVGPNQVSDITLTGTATRTSGTDVESGIITLKALGNGDSRYDLTSPSGTRSEVRNTTNGPSGFWIGLDGNSHVMAAQNCMTDAAWFLPPLSVLSQLSNPNLIATYIAQETRAGIAVYHLHFAVGSPGDDTGMPQRLSAEDVYLNTLNYLPVALVFDQHTDDNALTNIQSEVDYSNYEQVNGVEIPFRIQMFLNGNLFLDTTVESAVLNSGIPQSDFTAQ